MIELTMSNGEYLTHEDLEKYLNEYEVFFRKKFEDGILEFEYKELLKHHNDVIENALRNFEKIELIISNIKRIDDFNPLNYGLPVKRESPYAKKCIKLRGEELGKTWKDSYSYPNTEFYSIEFKRIKIENPKNPPFIDRNSYFGPKSSIPEIKFEKITSNKPITLKKGQRILFNLNLLRVYNTSDYNIVQNIWYLEKENVFPSEEYIAEEKIEERAQNFNLNCFIITATMGDINHPIVNDFRIYRDSKLLKTFGGRIFISLYYKIGPFLAKLIKTNHFLLKMSRKLVLYLHSKIK